MAHPLRICGLAASLFLLSPVVGASPVGLWKTFDDDSGQAKALVAVKEERGALSGRIVRLLDPADPPDASCDACPDERRGQPLVGLLILRNVTSQGAPDTWAGGDILDPEDGKLYRVQLKLSPDNQKLDVRGYIGTPLLGRTQTWQRVEEPRALR